MSETIIDGMIVHENVFDIDKAIDHFRKKDGEDIKYVLTSEIHDRDVPEYWDIFYRDTPHPKFGNRYFGLRVSFRDTVLICNADPIEGQYVTTITDSEGREHYSRHRHDFVDLGGDGFIDGGRQYVRARTGAKIKTYVVKDGELQEVEHDK